MINSSHLIIPDWPAPQAIHAISTTRKGGESLPPYDSLNLATHVHDAPLTITKNRQQLLDIAQLPTMPHWLNQVHGTHVVDTETVQHGDNADAIISQTAQQVCAIMTADCLPLLVCNQQGNQVAAIHAGWRGLAAGIIEKTIKQFHCQPQEILVWLGPAIGAQHFEVGDEVFTTFTQHSDHAKLAFQQTDSTHYLANIYHLATQRLHAVGVDAIYGGEHCTVSEPEHFFSYRRDGVTGRMASMIWFNDK